MKVHRENNWYQLSQGLVNLELYPPKNQQQYQNWRWRQQWRGGGGAYENNTVLLKEGIMFTV